MSYNRVWASICNKHGWDSYDDCPGYHSDELSDEEEKLLSDAWHEQYGEYEVCNECDDNVQQLSDFIVDDLDCRPYTRAY